MLNSLTVSAHNSLPPNQVSRLLAGALLLAAAALTGCSSEEASMHADLSHLMGHSHTWMDAADSSETAPSFLSSRHHAHTHELSRTAELTPHHGANRTL